MSLEIFNPSELGTPSGWNNGLLAPAGGRLLFVAGQSASDESGSVPEIGFVEQWASILDKILVVVRAAGGQPDDIARMTVYVTNRQAYLDNLKPLGAIWRERLGKHYPAMALVEVSALVDAHAMIEIEATAVLT
jgi:enamine deaminase RidA (YjgF/YER057c/UK114 family)